MKILCLKLFWKRISIHKILYKIVGILFHLHWKKSRAVTRVGVKVNSHFTTTLAPEKISLIFTAKINNKLNQEFGYIFGTSKTYYFSQNFLKPFLVSKISLDVARNFLNSYQNSFLKFPKRTVLFQNFTLIFLKIFQNFRKFHERFLLKSLFFKITLRNQNFCFKIS